MRLLINLILMLPPVSRGYVWRRRLLGLAGIPVGEGTRVNGLNRFYGHGVIRIGVQTWLGPGCRFYSAPPARIEIGSRCDIAPEVMFICGGHDIGGPLRRAGADRCDDIVIEDGCWIGARCTVLGGVRIGAGTVVAAGAVVNRDLPPNCMAAGVPARPLRELGGDETR